MHVLVHIFKNGLFPKAGLAEADFAKNPCCSCIVLLTLGSYITYVTRALLALPYTNAAY